jgi:hypothetical protein
VDEQQLAVSAGYYSIARFGGKIWWKNLIVSVKREFVGTFSILLPGAT